MGGGHAKGILHDHGRPGEAGRPQEIGLGGPARPPMWHGPIRLPGDGTVNEKPKRRSAAGSAFDRPDGRYRRLPCEALRTLQPFQEGTAGPSFFRSSSPSSC
jgi:hypothetical protein